MGGGHVKIKIDDQAMAIVKPKVYMETTIPSYLTARRSLDVIQLGHQHITQEWWENKSDDYNIYISELVVTEAGRGDIQAAEKRLALLSPFPWLPITEEAKQLAKTYLLELPMPQKADADALHLALASIFKIEYLLTWNCRHIAVGSVKRALPELNARYGLTCPTICTPEELLYENDSLD